MFKIVLINMPFAALSTPSFALTQLEAALRARLGGRVAVHVLYLSHDFARCLGIELYNDIASGVAQKLSGLGDWFFRQAAFPELPDNADVYFQRYYPAMAEADAALRRTILDGRRGVRSLLDHLIDAHHLHDYDLVGFTSLYAQNVACFAMAKALKQRRQSPMVVIGGANCDLPMGQVIAAQVPEIDYVFSGPALKSFPDFVEHLLDGRGDQCSAIDGVTPGKAALSSAASNAGWKPRGEELNINAGLELDYQPFLQSLDEHFPGGQMEPTLFFETSRGCWWGERVQCRFCGLSGSALAYRTMEPDRAVQQFESMFRYADKCKRFEAVDNVLPPRYPQEVFPRLRAPDGVRIFYEVRSDLEDRDLATLADFGVTLVQPGIEALATSSLRLMRKGVTSFRNLMFLRQCLVHNVYPLWNLLIGFPGEDAAVYEKYLRDLPNLVHLPPPSGVHPLRYDRFSPYFKDAEAFGLDLKPYDFYVLTYPFPEDSLNDLAYFFADRKPDLARLQQLQSWRERLGKAIDAWRERWYGRPDLSPPKLLVRKEGDEEIVVDTRNDRPCEHALPRTAANVLRQSARPMSLATLTSRLQSLCDAELQSAIEYLIERGLLFLEEDKVLGLPCTEEIPDPFYWRVGVSRYRPSSPGAASPSAVPSQFFQSAGG